MKNDAANPVDPRSADDYSALRSALLTGGTRRYWRSLDELSGDEAFFEALHDEFPSHAAVWSDPTTRRTFLKRMGASLALAGVVGCSDFPDEKIVPYIDPPESVLPGRPSYYATTFPFNGFGLGAIAESHEGRPTKIEGNPDHPATLGGSNVFQQASILGLYDPDRSKLVSYAGTPSTWGHFQETLRERLDPFGTDFSGLRLLTRNITSPTFGGQLAGFRRQFPGARWHTHDPTAAAGCSAGLGACGRAVYDFSKARIVVSLDADFLFSDAGSIAYARQFMAGRRHTPGVPAAEHLMNRLYVVESTFSLTGAAADHRLAVRPSQVEAIARTVAGGLGAAAPPAVALPNEQQALVTALIDDLKHARDDGGALIVAGDHQPAAVHALAFLLNRSLGSVGTAVRYIRPIEVQGGESLRSLVEDMAANRVHTLLILGGNPVYDSPTDLAFRDELRRLTRSMAAYGRPAALTAHLGSHEDETSFECQWHLPESHYLESWGDARAFDGTASLVQPLVRPLSPASRSIWEVVEAVLGRPDHGGYEIVRGYWRSHWARHSGQDLASTRGPGAQATTAPSTAPAAGDPLERRWQAALRKGVIDQTTFASVNVSAADVGTASEPIRGEPARPIMTAADEHWELVFRPDAGAWDGQYANNAWLQELPRPFTKLVWDNAALIGTRSAQRLGVTDGKVLRLSQAGRWLEAPVMVVPGIPDNTVSLSLGYGRWRGGNVANEGGVTRGYNAYALRTSASLGFAAGVKVENVLGAFQTLVTTRAHHAMAVPSAAKPAAAQGSLRAGAIGQPGLSEREIELDNRKLVRTGTLDDFRHDENWVARLGGELEMRAKGLSAESPGRKIHLSLYPSAAEGGWDYSKGHQWAMSIDQTACIGCNACVVACQAENNTAVVGKEEVARQREMHWIRIDDWFGHAPGRPGADPLDDPQVTHMPVPCQHCENAPCEVVCPVGATTHSAEGLNEMTYNRCVGTRYCSNNCPYKVRRFNFFLYSDYSASTRTLQYNPEVTVRSRGVMEKCTYCVQRLTRTRIDIEKMTVRLEERARAVAATAPEKAKQLRDRVAVERRELLLELQTACQQACPTTAIIFGDKNEPTGAVAKAKTDALDYTLLDELTTQPRTSYLARLSNPNSALTAPGKTAT